MATLVARTIDKGGAGDYPSHFAAEAANYGGSANHVTANEYIVATCTASTNAADTTTVTINGQTTDATRDITVTVAAAARSAGIVPTSGLKYRMNIAGAFDGIIVSISNVRLLYIPLLYSPTNGVRVAFLVYPGGLSNVTMESCVAWQGNSQANTDGFGTYTGSGTISADFVNCIAKSFTLHGFGAIAAGGGTTHYYNCTATKCAYNFTRTYGAVIAKNCLAFGGTTADYSGTFDADSTKNGYSNGSGPSGGSAAVNLGTTASNVFVDYVNNNFNLKINISNPAYRVGADLDGDTPPVTDDILGNARHYLTPCLGAFEIHVPFLATLTDGIGLSDDPTMTKGAVRTLADGVGVSDDLSGLAVATAAVVDGVTVSDVITLASKGVADTLADTIGVDDDLSQVKGAVRALADGVGVSDDLLNLATASATVVDGVEVSDMPAGLATALAALVDGIGASDTSAGLAAAFAALDEIAEMTDAPAGLAAALAALADVAEVTDTTSGLAAAFSVEADTVEVSDAAHRFTKQIRPDWTYPKLKRLF